MSEDRANPKVHFANRSHKSPYDILMWSATWRWSVHDAARLSEDVKLQEQLEVSAHLNSDLVTDPQTRHGISHVLKCHVAVRDITAQADLPVPQLPVFLLEDLHS